MLELKRHILTCEKTTGRRALQERRDFNALKKRRARLQGGGGGIHLLLPEGTYAACRQKGKRLSDPVPLSTPQHKALLAQLRKLPSSDGVHTTQGYNGYTLQVTIKGRVITHISQKKGSRSRRLCVLAPLKIGFDYE